jgi:molecular chaperone Hsp33
MNAHAFMGGVGFRGRLVRLDGVLSAILDRHEYPHEVSRILSEALALTAILASGLKISGKFSLQTKSDGPVSILVADYWTPSAGGTGGVMRGYARFDVDALAQTSAGGAPVPKYLGTGVLAFTVDQGEDTERYQGIVELTGGTLSDCAHQYFKQSEQLETAIRIAAAPWKDETGKESWRAGALMLQQLPDANAPGVGDFRDEAWRTALAFLGSVRDIELTDPALSAHDLLFRLFNEPGVRVWPEQRLTPGCSCAQTRAEQVLLNFSPAERAEMAVQGEIFVTCEFCNTRYAFFAAALDAAPPSETREA